MATLQAYDSRSRLLTDPIRNFKFVVKFHDHVKDNSVTPGGLGQLGFMSVTTRCRASCRDRATSAT